MRTRLVVLIAALLAMTSCGSSGRRDGVPEPHAASTPNAAPTPSATSAGEPMPTAIPAASGTVTTRGPVTVLDEGSGPELCLGPVAMSYPPQCGGPRLTDWSWADHEGHVTEAAGVRWGEFVVVGTFDGSAFTPTRVLPPDQHHDEAGHSDVDLSTPCPEPDGGWRVLDAAKTTDHSLDAVTTLARRLPGYADVWLDQSRNPHTDNDPRQLTVNVKVTHGTAAAERRLRAVWGGALCVSTAGHTERELRRIQGRVTELPGMLSASSGVDHVDVEVVHDDGSLQAWADATYGPGLVRISSALVPASG